MDEGASATHPRTSRGDRDETVSERADRNYIEIVQELRIAQTGVQILFGFLLALAFYETFPVNSSPNREVLTAALICTVGAAVCFTAPVVVHRLHFRQGEKEPLVWVAHRLTLAGMVLFTLGMGLALWLVLARLWSDELATVVSLALIPACGWLWVFWPRHLLSHAAELPPSSAEPGT